jgi:hypothetical protein
MKPDVGERQQQSETDHVNHHAYQYDQKTDAEPDQRGDVVKRKRAFASTERIRVSASVVFALVVVSVHDRVLEVCGGVDPRGVRSLKPDPACRSGLHKGFVRSE